MPRFDVAPFALPNTPPEEVRFEQPRDVERVVVTFAGPAPGRVRLSYLQKTWPQARHEEPPGLDQVNPCGFGWKPIDDWFNSAWHPAAVRCERFGDTQLAITFRGLRREFPDLSGLDRYDVAFRRTLGVRVEAPRSAVVRRVEVYTVSAPAERVLRVELDAGRRTPGRALRLEGYNVRVDGIAECRGVVPGDDGLRLEPGSRRTFVLRVATMAPAHRYSDDDGRLTLGLDRDAVTVSLTALSEQGPVWSAEAGLFVTDAADPTTFGEYRQRQRGAQTVRQRVLAAPEQSLAGAMLGQPRPHAVACTVGCPLARQRFWVETNGDVVLHKRNVTWTPGRDTARFQADGNARFFFDLGDWIVAGRQAAPPPMLAFSYQFRHDSLSLEQSFFAVPLTRAPAAELAGDDLIAAMVRFRLRNVSAQPVHAEVPVAYSSNSGRAHNRLNTGRGPESGFDDREVPLSRRDPLRVDGATLVSGWQGQPVLRCAWTSGLTPTARGEAVVFAGELAPGAEAELVLTIPFVTPDTAAERAALAGLEYERAYAAVRAAWEQHDARGARVRTPNPHLNAVHTMHAAHVAVTDYALPDDPRLINTSVGSSTYGNFTNESCMIVQELDQRGLHDEARRRIELWLRYQGTVGLNGRFSDHDGVFYGAGGFEQGQSYCQHHGWVLWIVGQHYLLTGDAEWLRRVAPALVAGCDWVSRQRRLTLAEQPHSRGWERGFLPAGGLEDVTDYCYWLSTNCLTWRGCDTAAAALEAVGHPEARRLRRESDAYGRDLRRGFDTMRRHAPLVRLGDGRWVPTFPSRLYCRGRDYGWIRETLEGSVYLLISGLYPAAGREAEWILDDFLDNRYTSPPYGYALGYPAREWFDRGGFSIQPNLLAGLLPHLERDEIPVYLWMFFNAWAACYREEITAMVEHPHPVLGFSNRAHYKTSDQSNAAKWLQYMLVWTDGGRLHVGRAVPRDWFRDGREVAAEGLATRYGPVSVTYRSAVAAGRITAEVDLSHLRQAPGRLLLRFRHPTAEGLAGVTLNGRAHAAFDAASGDVDLTECRGRLTVVAHYAGATAPTA